MRDVGTPAEHAGDRPMPLERRIQAVLRARHGPRAGADATSRVISPQLLRPPLIAEPECMMRPPRQCSEPWGLRQQ